MLSILVGRAGSGKSRRVLESIETNRRQRPQILLVPEHISHEAEMDLCRVCGVTASRDAEVLSFHSLAARVLAERGGLSDFTLDNGGKLLTMRRCLQETQSQLKIFGRPSQRASFLHQLTELADELYAYEVTPAALYRCAGDMDGAMGDKLRDLAMLFTAYDAKLHTGQMDARSRMQKLCDNLEESRYLQDKDLYVDGFSFFNRQEEHVLAAALHRCHSVTVTLLGERQNSELFQNALRQRQRLERMAQREGTPCRLQFITAAAEGALAHLERHFFGAELPYEEETQALSVYEALSAYSEVEYVSARIRELVNSGVCRCRDIGVSARSMERYGPLLEAVFRRDDIPAYISRRSDILEKPILTLLLSAVDSVTGGFEYEDMFRYLKTGLAGISDDECDKLENYVILWSIRGTMWLRDTAWTANPDGYGAELTPERAARLEEINSVRRKVRQPLAFLADGLKTGASARGKAETLYTFAELLRVPETLEEKAAALSRSGQQQLAEEYAQLWQILCGVLDQFVEILGDTELSGEEFGRLLRLVLTQYSVGTIPATLDQVKVSEITRNDRHRVRYMFLLGATDNALPQLSGQSGILDRQARQALAQRDLALSDDTFDELDNELQNIYACLAQPTDGLFISWPAADDSGAAQRPSFVAERVTRLFPRVRVQREDGAYRLRLPAAALAEAAQNPALYRYFRDSGRCDGVLDAMARSRSMERGRLSPEAVAALYGKSLAMSASRIDRVRSCHFGYFMQYGLQAKERTTAGFEAPEIGTFLHYLLENVTRDVMAQGGYAAVEQGELHRLVQHYIDTYAATRIDGYQEKSARFKYLFTRLRTTAYEIIDQLAEELRHSDFVPLAFELSFGGKEGDLPAITVTEGETTLHVTGKVDRVDGWLHDDKLYLRVVDYKTGAKAFDLTDIRYGLGMQMLLYLFALQGEGKLYFGHDIVPAGVLYHPARSSILRLDRTISDEKLAAALQREVRRSGMVLSEPEVLRAMEHSALESPCYLPVGLSRDGQLTGGVATAAQMGHLGRYVDKLLHQIAREIGSGNIDADPCARGSQDGACTYCPFASACYFEEGRDKRRYLEKTDAAAFWPIVEEVTDHE